MLVTYILIHKLGVQIILISEKNCGGKKVTVKTCSKTFTWGCKLCPWKVKVYLSKQYLVGTIRKRKITLLGINFLSQKNDLNSLEVKPVWQLTRSHTFSRTYICFEFWLVHKASLCFFIGQTVLIDNAQKKTTTNYNQHFKARLEAKLN